MRRCMCVYFFALMSDVRKLQLCAEHATGRDKMFHQASKTRHGTGLLQELHKMEDEDPETFLSHLGDFQEQLLV